jgi:hypothetical protein
VYGIFHFSNGHQFIMFNRITNFIKATYLPIINLKENAFFYF